MKKNIKSIILPITTILVSLIGIISFYNVIEIYNFIHINENKGIIDPDYHMKTLPYDYIIFLSLSIIIILSLIFIIKKIKRNH